MKTKIIAATAALLLLGSAAAYAYVAVTATATLTVNEALYIDVALVDVGLTGTPTRTFCTLSADKANATCAADVYPGESGQVGITINNRSTAALTTTETAVSSSSDVTLTINDHAYDPLHAGTRASIGTTLEDPNIDYAKVAQGLGVHGEGPITNPDDLGPAIGRALAVVKSGRPALVDVVTQPR